MPQLVACIPQCEASRKLAEQHLQVSNPLVKALMFGLMSIVCYFRSTLCLVAGIILDVSAILYVFAAINRRADAFDVSALTTVLLFFFNIHHHHHNHLSFLLSL
jgi:hypothetical protein